VTTAVAAVTRKLVSFAVTAESLAVQTRKVRRCLTEGVSSRPY